VQAEEGEVMLSQLKECIDGATDGQTVCASAAESTIAHWMSALEMVGANSEPADPHEEATQGITFDRYYQRYYQALVNALDLVSVFRGLARSYRIVAAVGSNGEADMALGAVRFAERVLSSSGLMLQNASVALSDIARVGFQRRAVLRLRLQVMRSAILENSASSKTKSSQLQLSTKSMLHHINIFPPELLLIISRDCHGYSYYQMKQVPYNTVTIGNCMHIPVRNNE
jgi:hypothetical protein